MMLLHYVPLGRSGIKVSRIGLGCMSYGEPERGSQPWSLGRDAAKPFFKLALDSRINFFDTAECLLGRKQRRDSWRDTVVHDFPG